MKNLVYTFFAIILSISIGNAQPWNYDFGTGTGVYNTNNSTSTTFLPAPPSGGGTAFIRRSNNQGGSFNLENPGLASLGSGTELRIEASTGGSVNKFSINGFSSPSSAFTLKFNMLLGSNIGGEISTPGMTTYWSFFAGNGSTYSDGNTFSGTQIFSGLRFEFGASGAITTLNRNGSTWNATGITGTPFSQGTSYQVEIFGNNSASTIAYNYNGASNSVSSNTYDLWVGGILVGDNLAKAQLAANATINSFMFYGEGSSGNEANIFLDDIIYTNSIAAESLPLNWLTFTGNKLAGGDLLLEWTTANEVDVHHFEIENSADGNIFNQIGKVPAKNQSYNGYSYTVKPGLGTAFGPYYRLKEVDNNGTVNYSQTLAMKGNTGVLISVYPNPVSTSLYVRQLPDVNSSAFTILNVSGQVIQHGQIEISREREGSIDIQQLTPGTYFLQIEGSEAPVQFIKN
ncbi:MAG: T9SS type A sorting domain-containing protein [Saprospiraceae bacterium]